MKKIFVSILVLAMASGASAAVIGVQAGGLNTATVSPGDTITVEVVTVSGFSGAMGSWLAYIDMDITTNNCDVDAPNDGILNPILKGGSGWVVGTPCDCPCLITGIKGRAAMSGGVQNGVVIYSFELKVSDTAGAGTATINLANLLVKNPFNQTISTTVNPLVLTIVPACCPGDSDGDEDYDLDDYYALRGNLAYADYLISGGLGTDYLITPGHPTVGFLWNECQDWDSDGDIDLDDYYGLRGALTYADYCLCLYPPSPYCGSYLITPDDPNVNFLWQCP